MPWLEIPVWLQGPQSLKAFFTSMFLGYNSVTGNEALDALLSKGGMSNMLTTVGLVINAMAFGGAMARTGLLERLLEASLSRVKTAGGLIFCHCGHLYRYQYPSPPTKYLAVVIPGQMFNKSYEERNLSTINLARTIEDSGTLTSALVPWNTCGAYMSATLGVSTFLYGTICLFIYSLPDYCHYLWLFTDCPD